MVGYLYIIVLGDYMYTIKNNCINEIIIKNSKFICYLYKIKDINDANNILDSVRELHKDATHWCYAYILNNIQKSSDDGEPSGTAGVPILKVLEKNNLSNVLAVVVRYFGGIKLGAGGLVRAYTKSVTNTLASENIVLLVKGYNIDIEFNYDRVKEIDYLLRNTIINNKDFSTLIKYNIDIPVSFLEVIKVNNIDYSIISDIYLEE